MMGVRAGGRSDTAKSAIACMLSGLLVGEAARRKAVLQKLTGHTMGAKPRFLFSLGGHSKQAGDERDLSDDVPLSHPMHLALPHHVQALVSV